jgi:hypothetical protein
MTTLTRRQALGYAAVTVAAAALPAVKAKESWSFELDETDDGKWVLVSSSWMPTTFYMRGDMVKARGKTYVAIRNKVSPPFFTEHGFKQVEA